MSNLLIKVALGHLDDGDRPDAQAMLTLLGLRRYKQLAQSGVVDMWTLKQIYAKAMAEMDPHSGDEETKSNNNSNAPFPNDQHAQFRTGRSDNVQKLEIETTVASPKKAFHLNAEVKPRTDALCKFPFADDGDTENFLLTQPPGPKFLSVGLPLRQRLAAKVYTECSAGHAGMKVSDIPKGLAMLGLELDKELAKGFNGTFSTQSLSLGQWQGVVKRFVLKEEAKKSTSQPRGESSVNRQSLATRSTSPPSNVTFPIYSYSNTINYLPAPVSNANQPAFGADYRGISAGGLEVHGYRQPRVNDIANRFLAGAVGKHLIARPDGWFDVEGEQVMSAGIDSADVPSARKWRGEVASEALKDFQSDDSQDAEERDAQVMRALGLLSRPGGQSRLPVNTEPVDNPHSTVSLAKAAQLPQAPAAKPSKMPRSDDKISDADKEGVSQGWKRERGGMMADYGPPQIFRRIQKAEPLPLRAAPSSSAEPQRPAPSALAELAATLGASHRESSSSFDAKVNNRAGALSLSAHRRSSKKRLEAMHQSTVKDTLLDPLLDHVGLTAESVVGVRAARGAAPSRDSAASSVSVKFASTVTTSSVANTYSGSSTTGTYSSNSGSGSGSGGGSGSSSSDVGFDYVGRGTDTNTETATQDSYSEQGSPNVSMTSYASSHNQYFDANLSVDSSILAAQAGVGKEFGYDDVFDDTESKLDEDHFEFTAEQTQFLGAGAHP